MDLDVRRRISTYVDARRRPSPYVDTRWRTAIVVINFADAVFVF